jgi:hypothetical protein
MEQLLSVGNLLGEHVGWGYLTGDVEGKVRYQGMGRIRLWKRVSVFVGALLGNLGGGPFTGNFEK